MMLKRRRQIYGALLGALAATALFFSWFALTFVVYVIYDITNDAIEKFLSLVFIPVLFLSNGIGILLPGYLTARRARTSLPASFYVKSVCSVWIVLAVLWGILEINSSRVEVNDRTVSYFFVIHFLISSIIGFSSGVQAERYGTVSR
ncbi:MAG: hypothetical protein ACYC7L_10330 [Nitrospirota bacterium]